MSFERGAGAEGELGQGGAEGDEKEADEDGRQAEREGDGLAAVDDVFGAEEEHAEAGEEEDKIAEDVPGGHVVGDGLVVVVFVPVFEQKVHVDEEGDDENAAVDAGE